MLTKTDIDWLKDEFLPVLAQEVKNKIKGDLDAISGKLDKFIGDIQDKRKVQEFHQNQHDRVDRRIDRLENKLNLPPFAD